MATNGQSQDLITSLRQNSLFGSLETSELWHLQQQLEPVHLAKGEALFHEGDEGDSLYLLIEGKLAVSQAGDTGSDLDIDQLVPGAAVGEMALLTGQKRAATVSAEEDSDLLRMSRAEFLNLTQQEPEWTRAIFEAIKPRLQRTQLARVLNRLLGHLDMETLHTLQNKLEWFNVASGETIIRQGDIGDEMYIVINGRLRIVMDSDQENRQIIGEVGAGDTVGEFALLGDEVRSATVYAIRESNVVRLRRPTFEELVSQQPQIMGQIAGIIARRQQLAAKIGAEKSRAMNITFVPLSADLPLDEFVSTFVEQLKTLASPLVLNARYFDELIGQAGAHAAPLDSPAGMVIAGWMTEQESNYEHLVYVADSEWSPWTQRCIRQADRLVLVASGTDQPDLQDIEKQIQQQLPSMQIDLVLVHPVETVRPQNTSAWLDNRQVRAHHHVRRGTEQHYRRLARQLTGRAIGLVLSGGGARGFAHIGAIRALQEAGVEVDIVGGTSMGSLIGAAFVLHETHTTIAEMANDLASTKKLYDYTLPFVSIMASGKVTRMLENGFGDTKIEDL